MIARLLVPVAAVSLLMGCSSGSDPDDSAAPAATSAAPSASPSPSPSPEPSPTSSANVIEVTYSGGEVTGVEQRVPVELGEQVVIRVTSDVVEEIHVHGYDLYVDLVPGTPAEVTFEATLPGSYEVELHEAGRPLFQLRVA